MVYDRAHVTHPAHYTSHPSGIECIEITEHMPFCLGNAVKYIWRAGLKGNNVEEDLAKAVWYLEREISRIAQISEDEDKSYDPWSALRDFFGDDNDNDNDNDYSPVDWDSLRDEDDDEDDGFDGYECGAFECDCDGSCFEMRDDDEEDEEGDEEVTYSDGRRRVTIAELRKRLNDDPSGDDPLQLLVTSILCHALTTNLVDALGDEDD